MICAHVRAVTLSILLWSIGLVTTPSDAAVIFFPAARTAEASVTWFKLGQSVSEEDLLLRVQCNAKTCEDAPTTKGGTADAGGKSLNTSFTRRIALIISHANETCDQRILPEYVIDCLQVYYGWAADAIPDRGEYAPIKKALRLAERKLAAIVSENVDYQAPVILPHESHKPKAKKLPPLRAVKKNAIRKAVAQARAVVQETELAILRSGEDPARRTEHFQTVAAAVETNLVLLRSA